MFKHRIDFFSPKISKPWSIKGFTLFIVLYVFDILLNDCFLMKPPNMFLKHNSWYFKNLFGEFIFFIPCFAEMPK